MNSFVFQLSFVTMGYLQEEVMTTGYQRVDDIEQVRAVRNNELLPNFDKGIYSFFISSVSSLSRE